ncbi:hypothetical protein PAXINDRAFT_102490 [Paxillus involutus ATCC 200175]|uniref:Uncharacterized protein n=1 Tax=Paxillus involutus ATCC 200175 TaxID=664439 RepID=A0A0C9SZI6_PAXIN|nr:hypothetical protein PAXINDRAFT_102490 [Paxillus involutus ATCC 200175]
MVHHRYLVSHIVRIVEQHASQIFTAINVDVPSVLLSQQLPNPSAVQGVILSLPSILRHPYLRLLVPSSPQPRSHIHAQSSELSPLTVAPALPSPSVLSGPHSFHPCSTSNAPSPQSMTSVDDTLVEAPLAETSGASGGQGQAAPTRCGVPADSNRSARTPGTVLGDAASPSQATPVQWSSVDIVDIGAHQEQHISAPSTQPGDVTTLIFNPAPNANLKQRHKIARIKEILINILRKSVH